MLYRPSSKVVLCLLLCAFSSHAYAADIVKEITGVNHKNIADDLQPPQQSKIISIIEPLHLDYKLMVGNANAQIRPTRCNLAYENAKSEIYLCERRNGYIEISSPKGASAERFRTAIWRGKADGQTAVFDLPTISLKDGNEELLKALQRKKFRAMAVPKSAWGQAIVVGTQNISDVDKQDSAALAAFTASQSKSEFKVLYAINETPADQVVVWGDLRSLGETTISKLDGKATWHVPLNGYAQAVTTSPGAHLLQIVFVVSAFPLTGVVLQPWDYDQPLHVELTAGHTYIVSFGLDDLPIIEDLGLGVHCERRKLPVFGLSSYINSYLACMR